MANFRGFGQQKLSVLTALKAEERVTMALCHCGVLRISDLRLALPGLQRAGILPCDWSAEEIHEYFTEPSSDQVKEVTPQMIHQLGV